jgi:hypothetical protein
LQFKRKRKRKFPFRKIHTKENFKKEKSESKRNKKREKK